MIETPPEFIPKHSHPYTPDALLALDLETLASEVVRLEDSITRLVMSNQEMLRSEEDGDDEDDQAWCDRETLEVLKEAIQENLITIEAQRERVQMIKWALRRKLGPRQGSNSHYQVNSQSSVAANGPASNSLTPSGTTPVAERGTSDSRDLENGVTL